MTELTVSSINAAAQEILERAGYRRAEQDSLGVWPIDDVRVYEDAYNIAAVLAFNTWSELVSHWPDAQGALVDLITRYVAAGEGKAWDGYLVLLTPGMPADQGLEVSSIQRDTSRVRKLVAVGTELQTISDVTRTLLPLLPVKLEDLGIRPSDTVLDILPNLVAKRGIPELATRALIDAFLEQQPLLECLHIYSAKEEKY